MSDEMRAFVALELDAALHERLARLIEDLKPRLPGLRFGPVGNAHLTMRFLGPSTAVALQRIASALAPAAAACPPADVPLTGLGTFPPHGPPRVLWLGLDLPASMRALQAACESAARAAGLPPETRAYQSHLTLGRWRERATRPVLPPVETSVTRIERLVVFRSELRPTGAVHTPLHVLRLGAKDAHPADILPPSA
jgi:RNA 2',3'-cyclic 3'-phosphodiesterase